MSVKDHPVIWSSLGQPSGRQREGWTLKVLSVFGTRPEAIKLAPVIRELRRHPDRLVCNVCVTV